MTGFRVFAARLGVRGFSTEHHQFSNITDSFYYTPNTLMSLIVLTPGTYFGVSSREASIAFGGFFGNVYRILKHGSRLA